jgi:hypothetical protein
MFCNLNETPRFTPIQNITQDYRVIIFFAILEGHWKANDSEVNATLIPRIETPPNVFFNLTFIYCNHPHVFKFRHVWNGFITCLYIITLYFILVTRQEHTFSILHLYS